MENRTWFTMNGLKCQRGSQLHYGICKITHAEAHHSDAHEVATCGHSECVRSSQDLVIWTSDFSELRVKLSEYLAKCRMKH